MASKDKDTAIDGLTRRVLSSDAPGRPADARDCPSADLLAAYYERSLDAAETARFERHFSTCVHCRQQLAALVRADESAPAGHDAHARPIWLSWLTNQWWLVPVSGTLVLAVVISVGILPRMRRIAVPSEVTTPKSPKSGTAPDAVLRKDTDGAVSSVATASPQPSAGVDTREEKRAEPASSSSGKAAAAAPVTKSGANAVRTPTGNANGARGVSGGLAGTPTAGQVDAENQAVVVAQASPGQTDANGARPSRVQSQTSKQVQQPEAAGATQQAYATPPLSPPPAGRGENDIQETQSAQDRLDAKKAQEMPPAPSVSGDGLRTNARSAGAAGARATAAAKAKAPAPAPAHNAPAPSQAPVETAQNGLSQGVIRARSVMAEEKREANVLIASPDPQSQWRIAEAGFVEHTENGGTTWTGVEPVENAQFVGGYSPAARTCWLVGPNGMIVVTTDAVNWRIVKPPMRADFTAITAKNGTEATVTAADGNKFATRDTGKTWHKVE